MLIKVKNLKCETVVGVYEAEKKRKQPLVINLRIDYDEGNSPKSDNVNDTLNYHPIIEAIKNHIESTEFDLVEKAVADIGAIIMAYDKVRWCRVEAAKTKGPVKYIDSFSVTQTFRR